MEQQQKQPLRHKIKKTTNILEIWRQDVTQGVATWCKTVEIRFLLLPCYYHVITMLAESLRV